MYLVIKKIILLISILAVSISYADDLKIIKNSGELRHIGIPYANFVTGSGDGLDVELMQGFAKYLGVKYHYVPSTWNTVFGDLTGRDVKKGKQGVVLLNKRTIKGDVIANGLTVLPWREEVVDFSIPTFPSGVWLVARSDSTLKPIIPSSSVSEDIKEVKKNISGYSVLSLANTCLDPSLYKMEETQAKVVLQPDGRKLNEMIPAILNKDAQTTLLDVPDALIGLEKWPGEVKVIGPISNMQMMAVGFRKDSPKLREAFNKYFRLIWENGTYEKLVNKYYPDVFTYFPNFFTELPKS